MMGSCLVSYLCVPLNTQPYIPYMLKETAVRDMFEKQSA